MLPKIRAEVYMIFAYVVLLKSTCSHSHVAPRLTSMCRPEDTRTR